MRVRFRGNDGVGVASFTGAVLATPCFVYSDDAGALACECAFAGMTVWGVASFAGAVLATPCFVYGNDAGFPHLQEQRSGLR